MSNRLCPICTLPLPEDANGNRKYHVYCEPVQKKINNTSRYSKISGVCNEAIRLDKILDQHFIHSQGETAITRGILEEQGFRWDFVTKITSNPPIFWIIEYGYTYTDNKKKIIIHHGSN